MEAAAALQIPRLCQEDLVHDEVGVPGGDALGHQGVAGLGGSGALVEQGRGFALTQRAAQLLPGGKDAGRQSKEGRVGVVQVAPPWVETDGATDDAVASVAGKGA